MVINKFSINSFFLFHPLRRNIDKAGSLDNYILRTPDKYLQSDVAIDLKIAMLEKLVKDQMVVERPSTAATTDKTLGLPEAARAALHRPSSI